MFCVGLTHQTAGLNVRERSAFLEFALSDALAQLKAVFRDWRGRHYFDLQSKGILRHQDRSKRVFYLSRAQSHGGVVFGESLAKGGTRNRKHEFSDLCCSSLRKVITN